jgi:prophage DNA circulation protein
MKPNQNRPVENLVEGLSQHARFLTKEERKAELRDRGVDVDSFLNEAHSIIAHYQKEKRLAWMKVANEKSQRFAGEESSLVSWVGKGKDEILAAFQNLLNTTSAKPSVAFRNKTDLTVEDMARILDDYERLRKGVTEKKPPQES